MTNDKILARVIAWKLESDEHWEDMKDRGWSYTAEEEEVRKQRDIEILAELEKMLTKREAADE